MMLMSGQDPRWGVILKAKAPVPIWHRVATAGAYTACGRKIGFLAAWLETRHLKVFAKKCKGCFPR